MPTPAEHAAKLLAWEIEGRRSIELHVDQHFSWSIPGSTPAFFDTIRTVYIETTAGQRFCGEKWLLGETLVDRFEHYGDGKRFADVLFDKPHLDRQRSGVIKRSYFLEDRSAKLERPRPMISYYVGRETLDKALPQAISLGEARVIERDCDVFLFRQVQWSVPQDQVYTLDRATGTPLKIEAFRNEADRIKQEPIWVWTAKSLDVVQGHPIVRKSSQLDYSHGPAQPSLTLDIDVTEVQFDRPYPASMFWPTFQPGVPVLDAIADKLIKTPGERVIAKPQPVATASQEPLRVELPSSRISGSTISLVLGAVVLLAGVGLCWRGR